MESVYMILHRNDLFIFLLQKSKREIGHIAVKYLSPWNNACFLCLLVITIQMGSKWHHAQIVMHFCVGPGVVRMLEWVQGQLFRALLPPYFWGVKGKVDFFFFVLIIIAVALLRGLSRLMSAGPQSWLSLGQVIPILASQLWWILQQRWENSAL